MTRRSMASQAVLWAACLFILLYGRWNVAHVTGERSPDAAREANPSIRVSLDESESRREGFDDDPSLALPDLEAEADLVIRATVGEDRTMRARSTKTELLVSEVLGGRGAIGEGGKMGEGGETGEGSAAGVSAGDRIYLIEPVTFLRGETYDTNGYQMAHTGEEYVFFLKHLERVEGYRYTKEQEISFMPVSTYYAKFALSYEEKVKPCPGGEVTYGEIEDYAILTSSGSVLSRYEKLKGQALKGQMLKGQVLKG